MNPRFFVVSSLVLVYMIVRRFIHQGKSRTSQGYTYSSEPSLVPRFLLLELVPRVELPESLSFLLSSKTFFRIASSYSASREFMVVRRLWGISLLFMGDDGSEWTGR